jgi:phosphopantothenoylcysteine synthetase/decarboxylase
MSDEGRRVLLAVTGSVAAIHSPGVVQVLREVCGFAVRCLVTPAALTFTTPAALAVTSGAPVAGVPGASDLGTPEMGGEPLVHHMELARWAELVLVLPATADVLARTAAGMAPDLLGTVLLATEAPTVFVPAMNPTMWAKPAVQRNVVRLRDDGYGVVPPGPGRAASDGSAGTAAMPALPEVLDWTEHWLAERGSGLVLPWRPARVC